MISFHDFNPLHQPTQSSYQKTSAIQAIEFPQEEAFEDQLTYTDGRTVYQYDETFSVEVILPKVAEESSTKTKEETPASSVGSNQSLEWIVGCFSNASNAERLVNQLKSKGIQAYILDVNEGLTRVSAGGASSQTDIQVLASKVSAAGFDGWTLKK
jgi:cell division protein FtsN